MIDRSPLLVIKAREDEIAARIQAAHEQAEAMITQARERAATIRDRAERNGLAAAEAFRETQLVTAREEAAVVEQTGYTTAQQLRRRGESRLVHTAQFIVESILPPE
jgi:vacuolar-type H+-ATPase subunit H